MPSEVAFDEPKALEDAKRCLLEAIKGEKVSPSQDAVNFAAAYQYLVNAELARKKADAPIIQ